VTYNGTAWASNNRVDGQNYDASGNLAGYRYDAASRITLAEGVCYLYDAEGRRVAKGTSLSGNVCENLTNIYVLGAGGEQLSEYDGSGNWKHTNVYGAGRLLATYDAAGTHFHLTDWLGTMRAQVSSNGVVDETCIDMPFGDDQNCSGPGVDATEHHFTGKVRDVETGFDYFGARYYASASGRWMSPDWSATAAPVPYAKLDYPQSLNLYAYVENNPLTMADADGHADAMGDPCLTPGCQQSTAADQEARKYDNQLQQNAEMKQASAVYSRQYEAAQSKARFAQAGLGYWQTNFTLDPGLGQLGKGANWDDEVYYKLKQDGHTPGGSYNLSEVIRPAGSDDSWNGYGTARDWDNVNAYDDTIRNNPFEGTSLIRQQYFIMSTEPGERPTHFVRVPVKIDGQLFWSQTITDFKGQVTITYHAEK
jgi:RHS repeat-associated protein